METPYNYYFTGSPLFPCKMIYGKQTRYFLVKLIIVHRLIPLIYRFTEDSSDSLERIKIRSQVRRGENIMGINLIKRDIRDRHCLTLHLKLEIFNLGDHIIVHSLIPLM